MVYQLAMFWAFQESGLDNTVLGLLEDELEGRSLGKLVGDELSVVDGIWLGTVLGIALI